MSQRRAAGAVLISGLLACLLVVSLPKLTAPTTDPPSLPPDLEGAAAAATSLPTAASRVDGAEPSGPVASPWSTAQPVTTVYIQPPVVGEMTVSPVPGSAAGRSWEPVVATHPTDPERIAVVYEHQGSGAGSRIEPTVRISHDGGRTWRSTRRSPMAGSGRGSGIHAAVAWGPGPSGAARLYWANMTSAGSGLSLSTAYTDDEGETWSKLRVERSTPPWVGGFPEIAVDRDPASPNHGTIYVGYNWLGHGARGPGFHLLASADFGRSWHATEIAPLPATPGYRDWWRIAYRLRPAPDGSVFAAWYQADLRHWDRSRIFAKGGPSNVGRLAVGVARVQFDPRTATFRTGPSRVAATIAENAFTTGSAAAAGTTGEIRPDPMWQQGFAVDHATGRLYLAVGSYGAVTDDRPRGTIRVGHSDDGGETWSFARLPSATDIAGHHESSIKPNLVAGPGYVLVTFHTLDDVRHDATVGNAYALSTDGGITWRTPEPISAQRWPASNLGGVVNGIGLRERAEMLADGNVFWAYGDGRFAARRSAGLTAIVGAQISVARRP